MNTILLIVRRPRPALGLLLGLLAAAASGAEPPLQVVGDRLLTAAGPWSPRALWYPLAARRDGQPFDANGLALRAAASRLNAILVEVAEGPALDDAAALLAAADRAGLLVGVRPLPDGDRAGFARLADRLAARPALALWILDPTDDVLLAEVREHGGGRPVMLLDQGLTAARSAGRADLLGAVEPALYQPGLSYGRWGQLLAGLRGTFPGPMVTRIEAAPPDWLVTERRLLPAADHPDLYRGTRQRPETSARLAGELLLVPEPEQLRLATYAACGRGSRGVMFDHAGHLARAEDPFNGLGRAAEVAALGRELVWFERFLADGVCQPPPSAGDGVAAGLWWRGEEALLLLWRDRAMDTRVVSAEPVGPVTVTIQVPRTSGVQVTYLAAGEVRPLPLDRRGEAVRVVLPDLDLTAAVLISPASPADLLAAEELALPEIAGRALFQAARGLMQANATLERLETAGQSAGGRPIARLVAESLLEGVAGNAAGYHRSALDLALTAQRQLRALRTLEFTAALGRPLPPGADPADGLTYATLPWLYQHRPPVVDGPWPLSADLALVEDFERYPPGAMPEHWQAMPGFDQTVATLRVVAGEGEGAGRWLRWQPAAGDPGALGLAFSPQPAVRASLRLRVVGELSRPRLVGLAAGPTAAPLLAVWLRPDGTVVGHRSEAVVGRWRSGGRHRLELAAGAAGSAVRWDGGEVVAGPLATGPVGALLLACRPGPGRDLVDLDDLRIELDQAGLNGE